MDFSPFWKYWFKFSALFWALKTMNSLEFPCFGLCPPGFESNLIKEPCIPKIDQVKQLWSNFLNLPQRIYCLAEIQLFGFHYTGGDSQQHWQDIYFEQSSGHHEECEGQHRWNQLAQKLVEQFVSYRNLQQLQAKSFERRLCCWCWLVQPQQNTLCQSSDLLPDNKNQTTFGINQVSYLKLRSKFNYAFFLFLIPMDLSVEWKWITSKRKTSSTTTHNSSSKIHRNIID